MRTENIRRNADGGTLSLRSHSQLHQASATKERRVARAPGSSMQQQRGELGWRRVEEGGGG